MKNISNMLAKSNLTPRERILMSIHNEIEEMRTGKKSLPDSDIRAVTTNWRPKNNHEVNEYNNLYHTWEACVYLGFDMQTVFLNTTKELINMDRALSYYTYSDETKWRNMFDGIFKEDDEEKSLDLLLKNTGIEYDKLVHQLTFERMTPELKKDLLALDPEVEYSRSYLEEEEQLSEILKDKKDINQDEKDKLIKLLFDSISWEHIAFMQEKGIDLFPSLLHGYFAGYPMSNFSKLLAKKHGLENSEEQNKELSKIKNLKSEMYQIIEESISNGAFLKEYVPLCNSKAHSTYSGVDTKLKHNEVLEKWIEKKKSVKMEIDQLIESGKFNVEERYKELFTIKKNYKIITGESLYYSNENYKFSEDFKKQIEILKVAGNIAYFINLKSIQTGYGHLLSYKRILEIVGKLVESDLSFLVDKYLPDLNFEIKLLNEICERIYEKAESLIYADKNIKYHLEMFDSAFLIDRENIQPEKHGSVKKMEEKLVKIWGENILK